MNEVSALNKRRWLIAMIVVFLMFLTLMYRLAYWQIIHRDEYLVKALANQTKDIKVEAMRGSIYDRTGKELAVTLNKYMVGVLLKDLDAKNFRKSAYKLAEILKVDKDDLYYKLKAKKTGYMTIAKWIDEDVAKKIKKEKITGVAVYPQYKRYYPGANFASYVIGHVMENNRGVAGIELQYDQELRGLPGRVIKISDPSGDEIPYGKEEYTKATPGNNLILTIDSVIQHQLEQALESGMYNTGSKRAMGIIMDPKTGDILAMVAKPDYDLNSPNVPIFPSLKEEFDSLPEKEKSAAIYDMWKNPMVNNVYEPGSTFKPIVVSAALEEGLTHLDEHFYCKGYLDVAGKRINCAKRVGHGDQTLIQAVANSCNPTMMMLGQRLQAKKLYDYIKAFGMRSKTGIDLPGESIGPAYDVKDVGPVELANISFGQGITTTPIQIISSISTIANDGKLVKPRVVKEITDKNGKIIKKFKTETIRQVISEKTAQNMRRILEGVVTNGGGKAAYIPGYRVGGKTGTAQKVKKGAKGYSANDYITSFVAIAPVNDPQIAVLIVLDEPKNVPSVYGSTTAAPIARDIIYNTLRYLNVKPDMDSTLYASGEAIIPEVRNMTIQKAMEIITSNELVPVVNSSELNDETMVVDMFPKPGEKMPKGSNINLYVENKKVNQSEVIVPDFRNKTLKEAMKLARGYRIQIKAVGTGISIGQNPAPGTIVPVDTFVTVDFKED